MAGWKPSLLAELKQVLWALLLVYLVLAVVGYLFGKQIGFEDACIVFLSIVVFVTISFLSVFLCLVFLIRFCTRLWEGPKQSRKRGSFPRLRQDLKQDYS